MYIRFNGIAGSTTYTCVLTGYRHVQLCGFEPPVTGIKATER